VIMTLIYAILLIKMIIFLVPPQSGNLKFVFLMCGRVFFLAIGHFYSLLLVRVSHLLSNLFDCLFGNIAGMNEMVDANSVMFE